MLIRNFAVNANRSHVEPFDSIEDCYTELSRIIEEQDRRINDLINYVELFTTPEYTTVQRDALSDPQNGQVIYNSTTNRIEIRQNGAWKYITNVSSV